MCDGMASGSPCENNWLANASCPSPWGASLPSVHSVWSPTRRRAPVGPTTMRRAGAGSGAQPALDAVRHDPDIYVRAKGRPRVGHVPAAPCRGAMCGGKPVSEPSQRRQEEDAVQLPVVTASHEWVTRYCLAAQQWRLSTPDMRYQQVPTKQRGCPHL